MVWQLLEIEGRDRIMAAEGGMGEEDAEGLSTGAALGDLLGDSWTPEAAVDSEAGLE